MLRIILGLTGAGLIGFGVFGGDSLEFVHGKLSAWAGDSESKATVATSQVAADVEVASVTPATSAVDSATSVATAVQANLVKADSVAEQKSASAQETVAEKPAVGSSEGEVAASQRALNIATESRPLKEVQASARNSEVAIARSLLNGEAGSATGLIEAKLDGAKEPQQEAAESKSDSVSDVLKTTAGDPVNNTLFVLKESVNLREGPSTEHPIVLRLDKGQELMEFKRDGRWVHVGAYGTSGKIGWVHNTLVGLSN